MRAFLQDHVGAGVGFVQAQSIGEAGNENHEHRRMQLSETGDELDAVHLRHLVIGDHDIESLPAAQFKSVLWRARCDYFVSEFFQDAATRRESQGIIVDN